MERLWRVEREAGSSVLRRATLDRLGGAARIVQAHLAGEMRRLKPAERKMAARMFSYLVTPTGTKIAHGTSDLVSFAGRPVNHVLPVLEKLAAARLLRRLDQPERYKSSMSFWPTLSWNGASDMSATSCAGGPRSLAWRRWRRLPWQSLHSLGGENPRGQGGRQ
jgi:hypothetical protein